MACKFRILGDSLETGMWDTTDRKVMEMPSIMVKKESTKYGCSIFGL